jgi:hypothetical protein
VAIQTDKPPDLVLYSRKTFSWFYSVDENEEEDDNEKKYTPKKSGFARFMVILKTIHPLLNIVTKYEFENKRLTRFMLLSY